MNLTSCEPQGSIFAVFLVSAYLNDSPEVFFDESLFDDGAKLLAQKLVNQFYKMILIVLSRGVIKLINFHFTKFKVMKLSLQNRAVQEFWCQAREHQVERVKSIRDFGVNISQNFGLSHWRYCKEKSRS